METARLLAQGVSGWLMHEFCCGRGSLFSERYMSVPIAQVLGAVYALPVHAEYVHPVLAADKAGPGRRPEVDFAVVDASRAIKCVVESKWVGSGGITAAQVIWDLLRLELISSDAGADAYFLLVGRKKHLLTFFESKAFKGLSYGGRFKRLLKLDHRRNPRLRVDSPPPDRVAVYKGLFKHYQSVSFPSRVSTSLCHVYPKDVPHFQYQAYVWRVFAPPDTARFLPKEHKVFAA